MAEQCDNYTKDGSVDIHKNPANKKKTGNWKACCFILGNQCLERMTYYGMSTNLITYLEKYLYQGNATAAKDVTNWSGTSFITPLIGAFLADSLLGRYWTIASFSALYVIGMILLTISTFLKSRQSVVSFVALYMVAFGSGAIKPCVSSFGADQFDETDEAEKKNKSLFFNWLYFAINIGMLIATSILVWIQMNLGWGWGFGIPAATLTIGVVLFFSGSRLYRFQDPKGSPFTRISQVIVASFRKYRVKVPSDSSLLYESTDDHVEGNSETRLKLQHTEELRFFDKAATEIPTDRTTEGLANPWRLCTVTQVEELKSFMRLLPIWACGIVFATVFSQMSALFILQGNRMDPHIGPNFKVPSASISIFNALGVIIGTPIYGWLIIPYAKKLTGHEQGFTELQRIGVGLAISVISMVSAGALELFRLNIVRKYDFYDTKFVPMSLFWQVPQYFLVGFAEVFAMVGKSEFFYNQAPDAMRSLCSALELSTFALGNYLSSLLVTIVTTVTTRNGSTGWIPENINRGHLDYFFGLLALLSFANFIVFVCIAKCYRYKTVIRHDAT